MPPRNIRGEVVAGTLVVIAAIAVGGFLFSKNPSTQSARWKFWKNTPAQVAQKAQTQADALENKISAENANQLSSAQEATVATGHAIAAAQATTAAGTLPTKELQTAATLNKTAEQGLNEALGKQVSPARERELELMVTQLNAGIAAGAESLKVLQGVLDKSVEREAALTKKLEAKQTEVDDANAKALAWAGERDAVASRFEAYKRTAWIVVIGLGVLWLSSILLPLLSKVFPALSVPATLVGAIWSPGVQAAQSASRRLNQDLVAMHEYTKRVLSEHLSPDKLAEYKKTISRDWMTASDGSAAEVERLKNELRL